MLHKDDSRDQSPDNPARLATDDVPTPRTPAQDEADFPSTDPGAPWAPPPADAGAPPGGPSGAAFTGGPPAATGTGGPDGARLEATDRSEASRTGSPDDGSVRTDAYHERATTGAGMGDPDAPGWHPEAGRDRTDTTGADQDPPAPVATGEGTYASAAAHEPATDAEPTARLDRDSAPGDSWPGDPGPGDPGPGDPGPVDSEPVDSEPVDSEPVDSGPVDKVGTGELVGEGPAVGVATVPGSDRPGDGLPEPEPATGPGPDGEAGRDAGPDAEAGPEAGPDGEAGPEAGPDAGQVGEAGPEAGPDAGGGPQGESEAGAEEPEAGAEEPEAGAGAQAEELAPGAVAVQPEAGAGAQPEELAPGEVAVVSAFVVWEPETTDGFRDRWQQIQLRFIDSPRNAADQAQNLVSDVIDALADGLRRQRGELDRWRDAALDDTEELRVTVRRYRDLLDRLLSL